MSKMAEVDAVKDEVFEDLDALREIGAVNMFGAGPYVQEAFDLYRNQAHYLLKEWMRTFSERHATA